MTTKVKNKIITELKDFPENKIDTLLNYIHFLKLEDKIEIPNKTTEKTFKDTDSGKNIIKCKSVDDMFNKLGV